MRSLDTHIAALLEPDDDGAAPARGLEHLNGDFATLYAQVTDVDAAPTAAQLSETELGLKDWSRMEAEWQSLRDGEVAELNRELPKARLPRVRFDIEPPRNLEFADEE
jgi:hypothetical protein